MPFPKALRTGPYAGNRAVSILGGRPAAAGLADAGPIWDKG